MFQEINLIKKNNICIKYAFLNQIFSMLPFKLFQLFLLQINKFMRAYKLFYATLLYLVFTTESFIYTNANCLYINNTIAVISSI